MLSREGLRTIDPEVLAHISGALTHGLGAVFWIISGLALAAFLTSLRFPHVPTNIEKKEPARANS